MEWRALRWVVIIVKKTESFTHLPSAPRTFNSFRFSSYRNLILYLVWPWACLRLQLHRERLQSRLPCRLRDPKIEGNMQPIFEIKIRSDNCDPFAYQIVNALILLLVIFSNMVWLSTSWVEKNCYLLVRLFVSESWMGIKSIPKGNHDIKSEMTRKRNSESEIMSP